MSNSTFRSSFIRFRMGTWLAHNITNIFFLPISSHNPSKNDSFKKFHRSPYRLGEMLCIQFLQSHVLRTDSIRELGRLTESDVTRLRIDDDHAYPAVPESLGHMIELLFGRLPSL